MYQLIIRGNAQLIALACAQLGLTVTDARQSPQSDNWIVIVEGPDPRALVHWYGQPLTPDRRIPALLFYSQVIPVECQESRPN